VQGDVAVRTLTSGDALGRYELIAPVANGGMAQVWAARLCGSRGFQNLVAIKTILASALDDPRMEPMFLQEAELAAKVQHPNVAATFELGDEDGLLYLVMEWVDGEPLRYVLHEAGRRGGIPLPIAVNLIGQACLGLQAAHEARDWPRLVGLYAEAADSSEAAGDIDAACFYLTHAYVFALQTGDPRAADLHQRLKARGREE